jgi:hypothetical protein
MLRAKCCLMKTRLNNSNLSLWLLASDTVTNVAVECNRHYGYGWSLVCTERPFYIQELPNTNKEEKMAHWDSPGLEKFEEISSYGSI